MLISYICRRHDTPHAILRLLFNMKKILFVFFLPLALVSCKKEDNSLREPLSDQELFALSVHNNTYSWYQNSQEVKASASASAHTAFFRVRFNETAMRALGPDGKLPAGASFPKGSVVVKELFQQVDGPEVLVAVMLKESDDPNSADGWLWGEYRSNGAVYVPVASGPAVCASCHRTNARDGVRVFDAFE
jgi:hypothetical protein